MTYDAETNMGTIERALSIVGGAALLAWGLTRRLPVAIPTALAAGALLARGMSGHCPMYAALGVDTRCCCCCGDRQDEIDTDAYDAVDEAGAESFPASDAPSWTGAAPAE